MSISAVRGQHLGSAFLCGQKVGATLLRVLCWSKGSLRGLPLSQQTVCLKLVVGGGGKKGSLHKTVSLELASQLERKMVTCSFFFFFFCQCSRFIFPMSSSSLLQGSTVCQCLSFCRLRKLYTCGIPSKILQTSNPLISDDHRKWRGDLKLTGRSLCITKFLQ